MLDIKFIRENPELIRDAARKKHIAFDINELIGVDRERVQLLRDVEEMRAQQNRVSEDISRSASSVEKESLIADMRALKASLSGKEEKLKGILISWQKLMVAVPNVPDISVPEGMTEDENLEMRTWGEKPSSQFTPKSHIELATLRGFADIERGANVSGFRGYFLKNDLALLSFAIWRFAIDLLVKRGYELLMAPSLVKKEFFLGTGYLPQGEEDLYKTQDGTYLSGTAEVPTMGYLADSIFEELELPKKMVAFSPCFRREAGSHGRDTKGLVRVHEFYKIEQVIIAPASHEESVKYHEELLQNAEELMQALELPYRVVLNCGGELGLGQVKKYDIEAWVPSEGKYRETHSASYFHDFQTRRLNIRCKDREGKMRFAHSLNNTFVATPRILVPLLECFQREDGSIRVPKALVSYLGKEII